MRGGGVGVEVSDSGVHPHLWRLATSSPVDIRRHGHVGAAAQKDLRGTVQAVHIPAVKAVVGGLKVLLPVGGQTVI